MAVHRNFGRRLILTMARLGACAAVVGAASMVLPWGSWATTLGLNQAHKSPLNAFDQKVQDAIDRGSAEALTKVILPMRMAAYGAANASEVGLVLGQAHVALAYALARSRDSLFDAAQAPKAAKELALEASQEAKRFEIYLHAALRALRFSASPTAAPYLAWANALAGAPRSAPRPPEAPTGASELDAIAYFARALMRGTHDIEATQADLRRAISMRPTFNAALLEQARIDLKNNRTEPAHQAIITVLERAPEHEEAQRLLAIVEPVAAPEAQKYVPRPLVLSSLEIDATGPTAVAPLHSVPVAQGPTPSSVSLSDEVVSRVRGLWARGSEHAPRVVLACQTSWAAIQKRWRTWMAAWRAWADEKPLASNTSGATSLASDVWVPTQRQQPDPERHLAPLISAPKDDCTTLLAQAKVQRHNKDHAKARALLKQAQRLCPSAAEVALALAWDTMDAGDYATAQRAFRTLDRVKVTCAEARFGLGEAYRLAGDRNQATVAYQRALSCDPQGPWAASCQRMLVELGR